MATIKRHLHPYAWWSSDGKTLLFYQRRDQPATPSLEYLDNMNRMLCPTSPIDFLLESQRLHIEDLHEFL